MTEPVEPSSKAQSDKAPPTIRFNFEMPLSLYEDLKAIAARSGRSGAADIARQLISEYVNWYRYGKPQRRKPAWTQERSRRRPNDESSR